MVTYIYGTGTMARDVYDVLSAHQVEIGGFIDHRPAPGMEVLAPEDISATHRQACAVVVAVHNYAADVAAIVAGLRALGYEFVVTLPKLYELYGEELGPRYWLAHLSRALPRPYPYEGFWGDEASRAMYGDTMRFRDTGDYALAPRPDLGNQYFPADLPAPRHPMRFVDCGAYDGDTIREIIHRGLQVEAIAAFEPDPANYARLIRSVAYRHDIGTVVTFPCAVGNLSRPARFAAMADGTASHIDPAGGAVVQTVSLDNALPGFRPTYIKMDIEGAEIDALNGARGIIRECRPRLAISCYHAPDHLWNVPLVINSMVTGYRLFLRTHGYNSFEQVVYAIPEEELNA